MSRDMPRWVVVVVILLFLVGMLVWARGPQHHHGRYVGALGTTYAVSQGSHG